MNQDKIGKFIAELRKDKNMTQIELAEKLGVSDRSVSKWENGRGMPDLSLFKPLCDVLDISINELLNGEKIKEVEYQKKLEENFINVIIDDKKKNKKRNRILLIAIIVIPLLFLAIQYFYNTFELDVKYDERTMKCNFNEQTLNYNIIGNSVLNTNYIEKEINNTKYYIFHSSVNIYNKRRSNWEYGESLAKILDGNKSIFSAYWEIDIDEKAYKNTIVYYTNDKLNKIDKMSDDTFSKQIKKMYKMCSIN